MNKLIAPISSGMTGDLVVALQDVLLLCLDRGVLLAKEPGKAQALRLALNKERTDSAYHDATSELVASFQRENSLDVSGNVDEPTAAAFNALLERWGLLGQGGEPAVPFIVSGRVRREDEVPLPGLWIRVTHDAGNGVVRLGDDASDDDGRYTIRYEPLPGAAPLSLLVEAFDPTRTVLLAATPIAGPKPLEIVDLVVAGTAIRSCRVDGKVASGTSADLGGLRVVIVDKGVGGDLVLAETVTGSDGHYTVTFSDAQVRQRGKRRPDLQARVFADQAYVGASGIYYDAAAAQNLDVMLDDDKTAGVLKSEHETLVAALAAQFQGGLGGLKEDAGQQDITYLANKTGWDARAVALAALADWHSAPVPLAATGTGIPAAYFYALFRAGVSASDETFYHTDGATLQGIWERAAAGGVITAPAAEIKAMVGNFQSLSARKLLIGPPLAGTSSLGEMLGVAALDEQQQTRFAQLYASMRGDMDGFWGAVRADPAFGATPEQRAGVADRLQLDGKLAFLTINNAVLMQKLHAQAGATGLSSSLQLAQMGYHSTDQWTSLLGDDVPVPKEIPGDAEQARANYAKLLAAQIRLSHPTASVAEMVQSGKLPLPGSADGASGRVHAFLSEHQGEFDIGVEPVARYVNRTGIVAGDEIVREVSRIQRVSQITTSDEAMATLMRGGIDAAYHVLRYDRDSFVHAFGEDLGGADEAAQAYDRSVQIHNSILNVVLGYLHARSAPAIGAHSDPAFVDPMPANTGDVIAYATLEQTFGSQDFCACEQCRSILSPAAYLVDLLLFLDLPAWAAFLTRWKSEHGGVQYPFADQAAFDEFAKDWQAAHPGQALPNTELSPFEVLMERRPDIEHMPLTCENTNTVLPSIDLVNETLEYYVVNGLTLLKNTLDEYAGHDTDGTATDDLLANPQFVMDAAYTTVRAQYFPAPLPFHQPLENLRRYFRKFDYPLALAMECLRSTDGLERGSDDPYGWRDILMEEIGLSRQEHDLLTDSVLVPLQGLFGFPAARMEADAIAELSNAKSFARRCDISYEELAALLKTRFINPDSDLIPKLERLGMSFQALKAYKPPGTLDDARFDQFLAELAVPPDPAEYGNDIKAWVKDDQVQARIMGLLTLAVPAIAWRASTAFAQGACVLSTEPAGPASLYYECTAAGTTAATPPAWPVAPGDTCVDGSLTWTCRDTASCLSFDNLAFRYADPDLRGENVRAVAFFRLARFIRLWKKLGWTIEQTDSAICALDPLDPSELDALAKLDKAFRTLLPALGVLVRVMRALNLSVKRDLLSLLACWSDIGTHGASALYRQLFLNPSLLKQDPVFADNGYGEFLSQAAPQKLALHAKAVRSAFNLTNAEYDEIIDALPNGADLDLTLANISAIYRHGWLARKLKLSARELVLLIKFTGLEPFAALDPTAPAMLRLIWFAQRLRQTGVKPFVALYLLWNQDLNGNSAPSPAQIPELARTLRADFKAIDDQFLATQDAGGDPARASLEMAYGPETASAFFALLDDSASFDVHYTHSADALEHEIVLADPSIGYDRFRLRLSHLGLMSKDGHDRLVATPDVSADFKQAVDQLFASGQDLKEAFFKRNRELVAANDQVSALDATQMLGVDFTMSPPMLATAITDVDPRIRYDKDAGRLLYAGVLTVSRREILRRVPDTTPAFQTAVDALFMLSQQARGALVLAGLRPELARRRKRQQALQRLGSATAQDPAIVAVLLDPPTGPYPLHAAGTSGAPALDDVVALETHGLAVQFFFRDSATGTVDLPVAAAADLDYAAGSGNPLPNAGNAVSGIWSGKIEAPEAGFYNFIIETDPGAAVTLLIGGKPCPVAGSGGIWRNSEPIELAAGALLDFSMTVEKVRDKLSLKWETPKLPRQAIDARYLYPPSALAAFAATYLRFLKAVSLMAGIGVTANELAFLATHPHYRVDGDGWLNALQAEGDPALPTAKALLDPMQAVLDFARLKAGIGRDDESLLTILRDPWTATATPDSLLFTITRWSQAALDQVRTRFGAASNGALTNVDLFARVYDAFALAQATGISIPALLAATTNEPTGATVRDFQAALGARYDLADWRDLVRPINDEMRSLQRDALVAYVVHKLRSNPESAHIDTPEKLFEYFLMDVQTDPCMQTSRIRSALSSVQQFIERCLMNLEPRVSSAAIDGGQWEWMKRYRVWEANRKVFLFPENWLEFGRRFDKSPFFKEFENELLQGDVTEERAAQAMLTYLSKLEEVAHLEHCGLFYEPGDKVTHVVARSAGAAGKYYYRRHDELFSTPWEQIKLDIEGKPIPVIWNNRLFVFWLRLLHKAPGEVKPPFKSGTGKDARLTQLKTSDIETAQPEVTVKGLLCWSEYLNGKWQPTRTSDVQQPIDLDWLDLAQQPIDLSQIQLAASVMTDGTLIVRVADQAGVEHGALIFYRANGTPELQVMPPRAARRFLVGQSRIFGTNDVDFTIDYPVQHINHRLLKNSLADSAVQPLHPFAGDVWDAPFFYQDARHVFQVATFPVPARLPFFNGFGLLDYASNTPRSVASLVFKSLGITPDLDVPVVQQAGFGVSSSAAASSFVARDAYIRSAIGSAGTVRYGDVDIGQAGSLIDSIRKR